MLTTSTDGLYRACHAWIGGTFGAAPFRVPTLGQEIIYTLLSFFIAIAINSTLNDILPSLSAFLAWIIMYQYILVQNTCLD